MKTSNYEEIFANYLQEKYGEPFTVKKAIKEFRGDRGVIFRVIARSDRFSDTFVMYGYPDPAQDADVLTVDGEDYEMWDTYPEVIFQNQYLDELRLVAGDVPLLKCQVKFENQFITKDEMAKGMKECLEAPKKFAFVKVYLIAEPETVTPEYQQAIEQQMLTYNPFSQELYLGTLETQPEISLEKTYRDHEYKFEDYMVDSENLSRVTYTSMDKDQGIVYQTVKKE